MKAYLIIIDEQELDQVILNTVHLKPLDSGRMEGETITSDRMSFYDATVCVVNDIDRHTDGPEYAGETAPFDYNQDFVLEPQLAKNLRTSGIAMSKKTAMAGPVLIQTST
ncbi:MAG: hypothetical protein D6772_13115 [Bacteroidetes bacterium]|nr:MAG: hypothetical protein D6772_13115 [Bacteroidota bacterium]